MNNSFRNISDYAYHKIKEKILFLEFEPGQRVSEPDMMKILEINRTPTREAIIKLSHDGLMNVIPQSGTFIAKINLDLVMEGSFIRKVVEKKIVSYALPLLNETDIESLEKNISEAQKSSSIEEFINFDIEFHKIFYQVSQKMFTWDLVNLHNHDYFRLRILSLQHLQKEDQILKEHIAILESIKNKNMEELLYLIEHHISDVQTEIKTFTDLCPHFFI
ncbi:MAG: GntR family transcriptional regulator [Brevinema sp.]